MRRLLVFLPIVFLIGAVALFGLFALGRSTRVEPNALLGKPVPDFSAPMLEGGPPVSLASQVKGPALINLFASDCAPCIIESPYLEKLKEQGVRIVGVSQKDEPADTVAFLERYGDPFAVILNDASGRGLIELGATGMPETYVVNSKGIITYKHIGALENDKDLDRLLGALKKAG